MPSGKTHDAVTFLLAAPVLGTVYSTTGDIALSICAAAAFLFGGLMFGPDLDTVSKQYSRWGIFRVLWFPYRTAFKHRSRWSHGLIFGTLFRVVYCFGVITVVSLLVYSAAALYFGGELPDADGTAAIWSRIGELSHGNFGPNLLAAAFLGMWTGAASHTFTDMAGSYIKTGRVMDFL